MQQGRAIKLQRSADTAAENFSRPDRARNFTKEKFSVYSLQPLSETTAAVIFLKSSGKKALAFFYWINANNGHWRYFFVSDSHLLGLRKLEGILENIEMENFPLNFQAPRGET